MCAGVRLRVLFVEIDSILKLDRLALEVRVLEVGEVLAEYIQNFADQRLLVEPCGIGLVVELGCHPFEFSRRMVLAIASDESTDDRRMVTEIIAEVAAIEIAVELLSRDRMLGFQVVQNPSGQLGVVLPLLGGLGVIPLALEEYARTGDLSLNAIRSYASTCLRRVMSS